MMCFRSQEHNDFSSKPRSNNAGSTSSVLEKGLNDETIQQKTSLNGQDIYMIHA